MAEENPPQSSNLIWVLLAGLLGFLAVGVSKQSGAGRGRPSAESKPANPVGEEGDEAPRKPGDQRGPLSVLQRFFATAPELTASAGAVKAGGRVGDPPPEPARSRPFSNAALRATLARYGYKIESLIVTVPDPVDSPFGFEFDQMIDVIQRAVTRGGKYVLDRTWLPWEEDKQTVSPKGRMLGSRRRTSPGALLFRREQTEGGEDKRLCIVFLVGETPISGVHKRALAEALDLTRRYELWGATKHFRIVGPYYTGSETSLRMVVESRDPHSWWSVAGAAGALTSPTGPVAASALLLQLHPPSPFERINGSATGLEKGSAVLPLRTTVIHDVEVGKAILHYLTTRNGSKHTDSPHAAPARVAYVYELNTGFGTSWVRESLRKDPDKTGRELKSPVVLLPFPLHISRLKDKAEQAWREREAKLGLPPRSPLMPSYSDGAGTQQEAVPAQDPVTTAAVNGKALADILSTVAREGIRYVGIVATDPRDQVFLTSSIRENCPGVQIFITGSDLLLTDPDHNPLLKGTVVGSTYPLFPENQRWTGSLEGEYKAGEPGRRSRRVFASNSAQGCYNAILALMGQQGRMVEYRPPPVEGKSSDRPPVWISMIGQDGELVPLQFFTQARVAELLVPGDGATPDGFTLHVPGAPLLALLSVCAFSGWVLYSAFRPQALWLFWSPQEGAGAQAGWDVLAYRTACLLSLAPLLVLLGALGRIYGQSPHDTERAGREWGRLLFQLPYALLPVLVVALVWPFLRVRRLTIALALLVLGAVVLVLCQPSLTSWNLLFFYRAVNFTSGVSPLVPLFFLSVVLFWWSFYQLKRAYLADQFAVVNPFPPPAAAGEASLKSVGKRVAELESGNADLLGTLLPYWRPGLLIGSAVGILAVWGHGLWLPTVEGAWCDLLCFWGFVLGFLLVVAAACRFLFLWRRVGHLMSAIALLPLARAFAALPAKVISNFGGYLHTRRPRLSHILLPRQQLQLLERASAEYAEMLTGDSALRVWEVASKAQELRKDLEGAVDAPKYQPDLWRRVSQFSHGLLALLPAFWARSPGDGGAPEPSAPAPPRQPAGENKPAAPPAGTAEERWVALAEGFVAAQVVVYLSQYLAQLRSLAWALIVCSSALLLAGSSYPFRPERLLLLLLLGTVGGVVLALVYFLVQSNRNELVSLIMRTTPNRFTPDKGFVASLFQYAGPVVAILIGSFGAFRFLLEPILRVLK